MYMFLHSIFILSILFVIDYSRVVGYIFFLFSCLYLLYSLRTSFILVVKNLLLHLLVFSIKEKLLSSSLHMISIERVVRILCWNLMVCCTGLS